MSLKPHNFTNNAACYRPATLSKEDSGTGFSLQILQNFSEQLFHRSPKNGCFWDITK